MNNSNMIVMKRQELYDEIWKLSVSGVAQKYGLHYQKLIQSLKDYNIPYPSSGYWAKLTFGKDVSDEKVPLPESDSEDVYLYTTGISVKKVQREKGDVNEETKEEPEYYLPETVLSFLSEEERTQLVNELKAVKVKSDSKIHPVLVAYKRSVKDWEKQYGKDVAHTYQYGRQIDRPLFLGEVSDEGIERIVVILDKIFKIVEKLGGEIQEDLSMNIRGSIVRVNFVESQDKKTHELTKQEEKDLLKYNEEVKNERFWYVSKPKIRKYDYIFNGKLRIKFGNGQYIKDNNQGKLENRIDEIIIELYQIAEDQRIEREKREEERRRYEEEQKRKQELTERINREKKKTQDLINESEDYRIACEIREYTSALQKVPDLSKEMQEKILWAQKKADWIDPVISSDDILLGKRDHKANREDKELIEKKSRSFYGW